VKHKASKRKKHGINHAMAGIKRNSKNKDQKLIDGHILIHLGSLQTAPQILVGHMFKNPKKAPLVLCIQKGSPMKLVFNVSDVFETRFGSLYYPPGN